MELSSLRSADPAMHFVSIDARWTHRSAMGSFDRSRPRSAERMGISTGNNRVGPIGDCPVPSHVARIADTHALLATGQVTMLDDYRVNGPPSEKNVRLAEFVL